MSEISMQRKNAPLFLPAIAVVIGMGISSFANSEKWLGIFILLSAVSGISSLLLLKDTRYSKVIHTCLTLTALSGAAGAWYYTNVFTVQQDHLVMAAPIGEVAVIGRIQSFPQPTQTGGRLDIEVIGVETSQGRISRRRGTIRLGLGQELWNRMLVNSHFAPGAVVRFETELSRPVGYRNPGVFDPAEHLKNNGIHLSGHVEYNEFFQVLAPPSGVSTYLWQLRIKIQRILQESNRQTCQKSIVQTSLVSGISEALLLGSRGNLCPGMGIVFRETGLVHLLAISGLHTGVIAGVLFWLLKFLPGNIQSRCLITIVVIWLYAVFTGSSSSVVRAALMITIFMLSKILQRPGSMLNIISAAAIILLIIQPGLIREPGFQLTFLATTGIAILYPGFYKMVKWIPSTWLRGTIAVSLAAQFATAPVSAYWFNRFGFLAAVVGLPAIPLTAIALITGWCGVLLSFLNLEFCLNIHYAIVSMIVDYINWLSHFNGATIPVSTPPVWVAIGLAGVLVSEHFSSYKFVSTAFYALLVLFILIAPFSKAFLEDGMLEMWFLDVGNGDCIVVRLPDGTVILIDAGGLYNSEFDIGEQVVVRALRTERIDKVNIAVITHPHPDHQLGMKAVIRHLSPEELWVMDKNISQPDFQSIMDMAIHKGINVTSLEERNIYDVFHLCQNNRSIILGIRYGKFRLLLTGDAEREAEAALLDYEGYLEANVLKVGHHGSRSSSSQEFIEAVSPQIAVITSGYRNQFRHPHTETLKTLKTLNSDIQVFRSDIHGMIYIKTDGSVMKTKWQNPELPR